jgi:hypothetical protein
MDQQRAVGSNTVGRTPEERGWAPDETSVLGLTGDMAPVLGLGPCSVAQGKVPQGRVAQEVEWLEGKRARSLPAAVRRAVLLRDHGRCRFPGCCRRRYVDVHQLASSAACAQPASRASGGEYSRSNSLVLCAAHHRLLQGGLLDISGDAEGELTFSHAQSRIRFGTVSGATPPPAAEEHAAESAAPRRSG